MASVIAFTGKGGVGKTTLSALTVDWLVRQGQAPILAVDADSNSNLHEALGVSYQATVGGVREAARQQAQAKSGISKQEFLSLRVQEALVEQAGYDLIVMGRPEGQGCYCFANNILRDVLDRMARNYRYIVIDSEAGLEHISRRTLLRVDQLIVVSDCTVRGVRTAARVSALADEVALNARSRGLIVNRVPDGELPPAVRSEAEAGGPPLLTTIPLDSHVSALDAGGIPLATIPANAPSRLALEKVLEQLFPKEGERA